MKIYFSLILLFLSSSICFAQSDWQILPNYKIAFDGSGAEGTFSGLKGSISFDPSNLNSSKINVVLDPSTISTGNNTKDKHARGDDWFDVEAHPKVVYTSTSIVKSENGFIAKGELLLHGIKKELAIPFTFTSSGTNGEFLGLITINRKDFGIDGPWMAFTVGEEYKVSIRVPVKKI